MNKIKNRPGLFQVLAQLFLLLFFIFLLRWCFFEPFLVPSGSMFPNLLVNDYIVVSKLKTGFKIPGTSYWLYGPRLPKRGEVVVFRSVKNNVFFVKRLIGLPGDRVTFKGHRVVKINDKMILTKKNSKIWKSLKPQFDPENNSSLMIYTEDYSAIASTKNKKLKLLYEKKSDAKETEFLVPPGELLFIGDHRSASSDGREWGFVKLTDIVGPVRTILFGCKRKNISTQFCDPLTLRWERFFKSVE